MSYNGIGLSTVRGSGTSGYVQANASQKGVFRTGKYEHRREMEAKKVHDEKKLKATSISDRKVDANILQHEQKRKIEVQCMELEEELEAKGVDEEEIAEQVNDLRQKLLTTMEKQKNRFDPREKSSNKDIHTQSTLKMAKNEKMERSFKQDRVQKHRHDDRQRSRNRNRNGNLRSSERIRERSLSPDQRRPDPVERNDESDHTPESVPIRRPVKPYE